MKSVKIAAIMLLAMVLPACSDSDALLSTKNFNTSNPY